MKILVVGGGGREHAIIKALKKSPEATEIFAAPGNGGMAIKSVTTLKSDAPEIYVALTGDEVAITNIRIN